MDEVEVVAETLIGAVHRHRRDDDAVLEREAAQGELGAETLELVITVTDPVMYTEPWQSDTKRFRANRAKAARWDEQIYDVTVLVDSRDAWTPTPAVSHAILVHNRGRASALADQAEQRVVQPPVARDHAVAVQPVVPAAQVRHARCREEMVDVGQDRLHPPGGGPVVGPCRQGVQPDESVHRSRETGHLEPEELEESED